MGGDLLPQRSQECYNAEYDADDLSYHMWERIGKLADQLDGMVLELDNSCIRELVTAALCCFLIMVRLV